MHTQKKLFTPIQIGPITLKHRVVMPPMSRLRAQWPSGIPSDLQLEYYRQRASDGGLIFTEALLNQVSSQRLPTSYTFAVDNIDQPLTHSPICTILSTC
jgi:2,4-dienoyl-CoA reductase-like NADH-dependent reductase (Old Yellow Enzyme family)